MEKNNTHLAGEYFVAAQLCKMDFQVAMTMGNAKEVDILIRTPTRKTLSIQVKTLKTKNCFDLRVDKVVPEDFYVFVFLNDENSHPDYFVLKGTELLANKEKYFGASLKWERQTVNYGPLLPHENKWEKLRI